MEELILVGYESNGYYRLWRKESNFVKVIRKAIFFELSAETHTADHNEIESTNQQPPPEAVPDSGTTEEEESVSQRTHSHWIQNLYMLMAETFQIPKTNQEAISSSNAADWKKAMKD